MQIIIDLNSKTSDKDLKDFRVLLSDLEDRFHFNWHVNTYANQENSAP